MTYDVVVGVGQSNVAGAATDYVSGDQYPTGIYMWNHDTSTIVPAAEPQSNADAITGMGVTNTFLKDYAAEFLPSGRDLLIVNVARGGTGFSTPSTNSSGTGLHWRYDLADDANNLARRGLEKIEAAMVAAGPGARIVAFLANHGSTDGSNNIGKTLMKTYLTAWINWIRSELDVPTVPYIAMQMRRNLIDDEPRHKAIDDATKEVATELDYVVHVPSPLGDAYHKSTDVVHFNALGVRTIGHSMFDAWEPLSAQFGGTWSDSWSDTWGGAAEESATVTAPLITSTATVLSPAVSAGVVIDAPAAAVVGAALAPSVSGGVAVTAPTASAAAAAHLPTITAGAVIQTPAATLTIAAHAPLVVTGGSAAVSVPTATGQATAHVPTVSAGAAVAAPAATGSAHAHAPAVSAGASATVAAPTATATGSAAVPSVTAGARILIPALTVTATVWAPSFGYPRPTIPDRLTLAGHAPDRSLTGHAPTRTLEGTRA